MTTRRLTSQTFELHGEHLDNLMITLVRLAPRGAPANNNSGPPVRISLLAGGDGGRGPISPEADASRPPSDALGELSPSADRIVFADASSVMSSDPSSPPSDGMRVLRVAIEGDDVDGANVPFMLLLHSQASASTAVIRSTRIPVQ